MKNLNSILRNVRHFSGIYLGKSFVKIGVIATTIVMLCSLAFFDRDGKFIGYILLLASIAIPALFVFGYISGRYDLKENKKYLGYLKSKLMKKNTLLETNSTNILANAEIQKMKKFFQDFFDPLIFKFILIKTKEKNAFNHLKKAMDAFDHAIKNSNDQSIKKIGVYLEERLYIPMYDAIYDKKEFVFDPSWINTVDLDTEKEEIYQKISSDSIMEKIELEKEINRIDKFLYQFEKKYFA